MSFEFVAVAALWATTSCGQLQPQRVDDLAQQVERASTLLNRLESLGRLNAYWVSICEHERRDAPPGTVRRLAELLRLRDARFAVSSDLIDVGHNLASAKPHIDAAAADEKRSYDELVRTQPILFNARIHYDAVMCVKRKIETGTLDAEFCRGLLSAKSTN